MIASREPTRALGWPSIKGTKDKDDYEKETSSAFELGFNGSWFDSTLELRAAAFYYKYHDYQVFLFKSRFGSPPQFEVVYRAETGSVSHTLLGGLEVSRYTDDFNVGFLPPPFMPIQGPSEGSRSARQTD